VIPGLAGGEHSGMLSVPCHRECRGDGGLEPFVGGLERVGDAHAADCPDLDFTPGLVLPYHLFNPKHLEPMAVIHRIGKHGSAFDKT
jgi:hypothetical protein